MKNFDPKINERDFKGVWIPRELYLNPDLSWTEKILLIEIDSLDKGDGCWASNEHFAGFLGISEQSLKNMFTKLRKKEYIIDCHFDGRKRYVSVQTGVIKRGPQTSQNYDPRRHKKYQSQSKNSSHSCSIEQQNGDSCAPNNTMNNTFLGENKFSRGKELKEEESQPCEEEEEEEFSPVAVDEDGYEIEDTKKKDTRRVKDKEAIFKLFSKTKQPWWYHKQQREAALRLFDMIGYEEVAKAMKFYHKYKDDPYCPQISTPYQFEQKLENLRSFRDNILGS
jgi:hypothetical protein